MYAKKTDVDFLPASQALRLVLLLLRHSVQVSSAFGISTYTSFLIHKNAINCAAVSEHVIKVMKHSYVRKCVCV